MQISSDDEPILPPVLVIDAEDEAEVAADLAQTVVDLEPLKDRVNKSKCSLFNGQRCIDQFRFAEQDQIQ